MDCLQCQTLGSSKTSENDNRSMADNRLVSQSEICSIHSSADTETTSLRNDLSSKQPPQALKFSVSAILARAAQASSLQSSSVSSVSHALSADNDSLSEDMDHADGSEGTAASSDPDNLQHSSKFPEDVKPPHITYSSSTPCPPSLSTSLSSHTAASMAMSMHSHHLLGSSTFPSAVSVANSLAKPIPRPLGTSPLFNGGASPLQTLLYRHPYLAAAGMLNIGANDIHI